MTGNWAEEYKIIHIYKYCRKIEDHRDKGESKNLSGKGVENFSTKEY